MLILFSGNFLILENFQWHTLGRTIKTALVQLNIFEETAISTEHDIRSHRIATRLYLVLMALSMIICMIYTSRSEYSITKTIERPTQQEYEAFRGNRNESIQCPCNNISILHKNFTLISADYHQLCSSDFVKQEWYEMPVLNKAVFGLDRFILLSPSYFRAMSLLCETAYTTMISATDRYLSTTLIATQVIQPEQFYNQMNASVDLFWKKTLKQFLFTNSFISNIVYANEYMNLAMTNTKISLNQMAPVYNGMDLPISSVLVVEANNIMNYCVRDHPTDSYSLSLYLMYLIEDVSSACNIAEIALNTSLTCWYQQSCLDAFRFVLSSQIGSNPIAINALDSTEPSRFWPDVTTLEPIYKNLMVENFSASSSYDSFYDICSPSYCIYTHKEPTTILVIITTMFGLFGGLNVALRLLTRFLVKLVFESIATSPNAIWSSTMRK